MRDCIECSISFHLADKKDATGENLFIQRTLSWVNEWVVRRGLCPWAAAVANDNKLRIAVISEPYISTGRTKSLLRRNQGLLRKIRAEVMSLTKSSSEFETTILILPKLKEFMTLVEVVSDVERMLERTGLDKHIQVASFHPQYMFQNTEMTSVENYTNRSPYPLLHLLRVKQVEKAIQSVNGNTDFIWQRNIRQLREEGLDNVLRDFRAIGLLSDED